MADLSPLPHRNPSIEEMGGLQKFAERLGWDWPLFCKLAGQDTKIATLRDIFRKKNGKRYSSTRMRELRDMYLEANKVKETL